MMNIPLQVYDVIYQHTLNDVSTVIGNGQFTGVRVVGLPSLILEYGLFGAI